MGRDADIVQVGLLQQGLKEGAGVAEPVSLHNGGVSSEAITIVDPGQPQLSCALYEEQGIAAARQSMYHIHHSKIHGTQLQKQGR